MAMTPSMAMANTQSLPDPENASILHEILALLQGVTARIRSAPSIGPKPSAQVSYSPDMGYPEEGRTFVAGGKSSSKALDGLSDRINLWARDHGYTVSIACSTKRSGKRRRVLITCSRAGFPRYKVPEATDELI